MNTSARYLWCLLLITGVSTVTLTATQCSMTSGITHTITHRIETSNDAMLAEG